MPVDRHDRPRAATIWASLAIPVYYSAVVVHRLFGSRTEHLSGSWEERIRYRQFVLGIPALVGFLAAGILVFLAWRDSRNAELAYARRTSTALEDKDHLTAEVGYTRLLGIRPDEPRYRFGLGVTAAERGDMARAEQLIAPLAPADKVGFVPAHLWMVDRLLQSGEAGGRDRSEELRVAEAHLIRLRDDPEFGARVRDSLMRLYLSTGRTELVLDDAELRKAAEETAETRFAVVQELARRGEGAQVQAALGDLVESFQADVRRNRDDRRARVLLCKSLALSGDLRAAVASAEEGLKLDPAGPFGPLLAELMAARAAQVRFVEGLTDAERRATYRRASDLLKQFGADTPLNDLKLADLARLMGDETEVERRLLKAAEHSPAARLQLGDDYAVRGRRDDAEKQWWLVAERYETLDPARQQLGGELAIAAGAALRLERFDEAEKLLSVSPPRPEVTALRTALYATWYDVLGKSPDAAAVAAKRFELLKTALTYDPWSPPIMQRMLHLAKTDQGQAAEIRAYWLDRIASGNVPAVAYLMLGTDALERDDETAAFRYLEQAYRLRPDAVEVLNNLAWAFLHADEPQPERALELATAALKRAPNDPRLIDTRFRAYAKLGKWPEALADLERCAAAMTGNRGFHEAAAEVYDRLKQPAVAAEHRRRASLAKPADERPAAP